MKHQTPSELFAEYRRKTEKRAERYNIAMNVFPGLSFPTLAKQIWTAGMLAEIYGTIVHTLDPSKDPLEDWRRGK